MTRAIITTALLTFSIAAFAQEESYEGFSVVEGAIVYSEVYDSEGNSAAEIISSLSTHLGTFDEVMDLSVDGESLTYSIVGRSIDVHTYGLKNSQMKAAFLQPFYATVPFEKLKIMERFLLHNHIYGFKIGMEDMFRGKALSAYHKIAGIGGVDEIRDKIFAALG